MLLLTITALLRKDLERFAKASGEELYQVLERELMGSRTQVAEHIPLELQLQGVCV